VGYITLNERIDLNDEFRRMNNILYEVTISEFARRNCRKPRTASVRMGDLPNMNMGSPEYEAGVPTCLVWLYRSVHFERDVTQHLKLACVGDFGMILLIFIEKSRG
jgi:hypothetical protein